MSEKAPARCAMLLMLLLRMVMPQPKQYYPSARGDRLKQPFSD